MKALFALVDQRWMSPPTVRMHDLKRLAAMGYATQCGRLFHPTPEADRLAALLRQPKPQAELFA
jgi:hypothetical protein